MVKIIRMHTNTDRVYVLTFHDVEVFLTEQLQVSYDEMPVFSPGPTADTDMQDIAPDRLVLIAIQGGLPLDSEKVFQRPSVSIRSIGVQGTIGGDNQAYTDAETLAQLIDKAMTSVDHSQLINGKWTLSIQHSGGTPTLLQHDDASRFHFLCSYIWEVVY